MAKNHFVIILTKFCMVAVYTIRMLMLSPYWFPQHDFLWNQVLWFVVQCGLVFCSRSFEGTYRVHPQRHESVITMTMKAARSFETSRSTYPTIPVAYQGGGGLGVSSNPPPKFRRPSKIVPDCEKC